MKQVIIGRYHPASMLKRGKDGVLEALSILSGVPKDIGKLIKQARRGNCASTSIRRKRLSQFGIRITQHRTA